MAARQKQTDAKKKTGIILIGSVCVASLGVVTFFEKVEGYVKSTYLIPCVDRRIKKTLGFSLDKIEVMYQYSMETARKDKETAQLWDKCVDNVYSESALTIQKVAGHD